MTVALSIHVAAGALAIAFGAAAASTRKGAQAHRLAGQAFAVSMLTMAGLGSYIAIGEPKVSSVAVGVLTLYYVLTGWRSARRRQPSMATVDVGLTCLGLCLTAVLMALGFEALASPGGTLDKAPFEAFFIFASFAGLGSVLDIRLLIVGSIPTSQRLIRHLWRMSIALFFAASFFFLGQQQVMPGAIKGSPVLFIPAFAPLALLAYWLLVWSTPKQPASAASKRLRVTLMKH